MAGRGHEAGDVAAAGPLRVHCDVLAVPEDDQQVVFITRRPWLPSARAFRHLAAAIP